MGGADRHDHVQVEPAETDANRRVLSVSVETDDAGTKTHRINVTNVSFVRITRGALTKTGVALVIVVAAIFGFLLSRWGVLAGVIGFGLTAVVVFAALVVPDEVEIGTTAANHRIDVAEDSTDAITSGLEELGYELGQLTSRDYWQLAAIAVVAGLLAGIVDLWLGVVVAVATAGGLYYYLPETREGERELAITAPTAGSNPIESEFLALADETIAIERTVDETIRRYNYRYYFVPENIVSITESEETPWWFGPALVVAILSGPAALVFLIAGDLWALLFTLALGGTAVALLALWNETKRITVRSHGDVSREFLMTAQDVSTLLAEFDAPGGSTGAGTARSVDGATELPGEGAG